MIAAPASGRQVTPLPPEFLDPGASGGRDWEPAENIRSATAAQTEARDTHFAEARSLLA